MELKIETLGKGKVKITCEGGRVLDTRNYRSYSSVRCDEKLVRYFEAVKE